MSTEHLEIPCCPKCTLQHTYKLKVERALVMKLASGFGATEQPRRVRFTRFFTCLTKGEDFQATFSLTDTSSSRIQSVEVAGAANDSGKA